MLLQQPHTDTYSCHPSGNNLDEDYTLWLALSNAYMAMLEDAVVANPMLAVSITVTPGLPSHRLEYSYPLTFPESPLAGKIKPLWGRCAPARLVGFLVYLRDLSSRHSQTPACTLNGTVFKPLLFKVISGGRSEDSVTTVSYAGLGRV